MDKKELAERLDHHQAMCLYHVHNYSTTKPDSSAQEMYLAYAAQHAAIVTALTAIAAQK